MKPIHVLASVAVLAGLVLGTLEACAPAFRAGARVRIASETALIMYDSATKTEHFIRQGTFDTKTRDFGFLVPTPSRPELGEVDRKLFADLRQWSAKPRGKGKKDSFGGPPGGGKVEVLEEKRVAGLDAAVLKANDARALQDWLKKHGYSTRPALEEWLDRYVKDGWIITAFKVAKSDPTQPRVATAALRMTFQTDKPFYPYREPEDMRAPAKGKAPSRLLRVYFIGDGRAKGSIGEAGAWPGKATASFRLTTAQWDTIHRHLKLPAGPMPRGMWLTEFEDSSSPRRGTDELYFTRAALKP